MLFFVVEWRARPLKRHRHTRTGHTYDPSAPDKKAFLALARPHAPRAPFEGELRATIVVRIRRPKKPAHAFPKAVGDCDNLAKLILDALQQDQLFFKDDSQVSELYVRKCYGDRDEVSVLLERPHGEEPPARKRARGC